MSTLAIIAVVVGALALALLTYAIGVRVAERRRTVAGEMGGGDEFRRAQPRRQQDAVGKDPAGGAEARRTAEELESEYEAAEDEAQRSAKVGREG